MVLASCDFLAESVPLDLDCANNLST